MHKKIMKYGLRFIVANLFHYYLKMYDRSFSANVFDYDMRGIAFQVLFVGFAMLVWECSARLYVFTGKILPAKYSFSQKSLYAGIILVIFGFISSVIFGNLYFIMDTRIFNKTYYWNNFEYFDFDLNAAGFLFYLLILGINGFIIYIGHLKEAEIYSEKLKKENIQAQYEALKNQIDPHFFFNSLSVLTALVYKDAELAADYITKLSKLYRYILDRRDNLIVSLQDELEFLEIYLYLQNIRYDGSIKFFNTLPQASLQNAGILPNTLQMLAENAVKHNKFSNEMPLNIYLFEENEYFVIRNNHNKKSLIEPSLGIGLDNITKRYKLVCNENIIIEDLDDSFTVKFPFLRLNSNEYFNI